MNVSCQVLRVEVESNLMAEGGWYTLDWNVRLPMQGIGRAKTLRSP